MNILDANGFGNVTDDARKPFGNLREYGSRNYDSVPEELAAKGCRGTRVM